MSYVATFFAAVFLVNSAPHLAHALLRRPFPTPFAKPRFIGSSPPLVNLGWGSANLVVGCLLLFVVAHFAPGPNAHTALLAGSLLLSAVAISRSVARSRARAARLDQ
jgi:hypothetical protein